MCDRHCYRYKSWPKWSFVAGISSFLPLFSSLFLALLMQMRFRNQPHLLWCCPFCLNMYVCAISERNLESQMLLRLQHRFFCLLCSGLNSQNEMCLSFLSKAWFNSVFQRVKYSTRFESWWHMKYLAAIASWNQALCLFNLMGDIAPLFMVCILPLSSLLCCYPEDPTILCCVLMIFPWRTRSLIQLLLALA